MRDLTSCFSEDAIKVSDSSCSGSNPVSSMQNTVSCIYKTNLATGKQLLITVTWCKNLMGPGLRVDVDEDPSCICKVETKSWRFWKKKGSRSFESDTSKVDIFWDLSSARYESGPEPAQKFYVAVVVDSTLGLLLGDMGEEEAIRKFDARPQTSPFFLVARKEHIFGRTLFSTKARFNGSGAEHEVLIKCKGENGGSKDPELSVSIDRKKVVQVKKLQWNFRGNQTIVIDGLQIEMMWDVHDWFFNAASSGFAVFLFRTRSEMDSSLSLGEKLLQKEESAGFSLLIYACKSP